MFKSWRGDKKKIKAVFKLQFQATQVPRLKKSVLTISLVPEDVGKPTFKLEKAAVQDGACSWEKPIYVTVKLVREEKTGKLNEKIYHFIVSSGSSKSGYLGEASIDFADFEEEAEPLTVSLPLKFANSGAILHVTIQKMQGGTDQRYIEENGDPTIHQDEFLKTQKSNGHTDGNNKSFAEATIEQLSDNVPIMLQDGSFKGSIGSNASSESTSRQNSTVDAITTKKRTHRRSSTDWSVGTASDGSLVDSINSHEDNLQRELQEASDESIEKLKSQISSLMRQAELSELELHSIRKQIVKESRRTQDLSRQIIDLQEERDACRAECEQLKSLHKGVDVGEALNQLQTENKYLSVQMEEINRDLSHERELCSTLQMQLQKTQNSNSELILALKGLDEMLDQKNMEISSLSSKAELNKKENQDQPLHELAWEQNDSSKLFLLKRKIAELSDEIEIYRKDRLQLEKYIEQISQDCEDLKQKNHNFSSKLEQNRIEELKAQKQASEFLATINQLESHVQRLEKELEKQTKESLESLVSINVVSINELETQVKGLEKELEKQAQEFKRDLDAMTCAKIEQEQKAIHAEEALRKTRWKNAVTAERLQEEFRRLSVEMARKFDENEKLTMKALTEANELQVQKRILEESLQKCNEELALNKDQNKVKVEELSTQLDLRAEHIEQISLELEDKSKKLRYAQKHGEEKREALSMEIQMLKAKIETITKEKNDTSALAKQVKLRDETKQAKTAHEETDMLIKRWSREKDELERKFALAKKEAETTQEQLVILRSLKDEKEIIVEKLLSELESMRAQHIQLKHNLPEEELEKEDLQKQVLQLKCELQKKQDQSTSLEKQLKNNDGRDKCSDENLTPNKTQGAKSAATILPNFREPKARGDIGENFLHSETSTTEKKSIEKEVSVGPRERDECNLTELLTDMARQRERNKSMERELKEMQERYSEISLKFAEVEGERQKLVMTVRNLKSGKKN